MELPDTNFDALPEVISAIVQDAGQTCSAGSRLLVKRKTYEKSLSRLSTAFSKLRVGLSQMDLDCGPLICDAQVLRIKAFLNEAQRDGLAVAVAVAGQDRIPEDEPAGRYYRAPTILRYVPITHRLAQKEVFRPVIAAIPFDDEAQAIKLAIGTDYGLVSSIWTRDGARQLRLARKLLSGQVFINNYCAGGGIALPFGGVNARGCAAKRALNRSTASPSSKRFPSSTTNLQRPIFNASYLSPGDISYLSTTRSSSPPVVASTKTSLSAGNIEQPSG